MSPQFPGEVSYPGRPAAAENKWQAFVTVSAIVLISMNLRAPITSVGPVLSEISQALRLSTVQAGLITTIPVLAFGLFSGLVSRLARRVSMDRMLFASLILLTAGLLIRPAGNTALLFAGTAVIGCAITVGNVLMPAFLKQHFPSSLGLMTGIYAGFMNLFAALASGFSIYFGRIGDLGWKASIGIWAPLALLGGLVWLFQVRLGKDRHTALPPGSKRSLAVSGLAWTVTAFMGLQSMLFYSIIAWLPDMLRDWGMAAEQAGWILSYKQLAQLPVVFAAPILAARMKDQGKLIWLMFLLLAAGLAGVLFGKIDYILPSVVLIGIGLGLGFSLAVTFLSLRSRTADDAKALSGMSQAYGYFFAALGPVAFGWLKDLSGDWTLSLLFLLLLSLALLASGMGSARPRFV